MQVLYRYPNPEADVSIQLERKTYMLYSKNTRGKTPLFHQLLYEFDYRDPVANAMLVGIVAVVAGSVMLVIAEAVKRLL